jgi:hypothetical protein
MSKGKGNVNSKNYTTMSAEERSAFDRINPQVDSSREALQQNISDSLSKAAVEKTGEQTGILNADAMQRSFSGNSYEASKSVNNSAQIASLASRAFYAGTDKGQREKAQQEMGALKAQMGLTQIDSGASVKRAGNQVSEDLTRTMSDAAVDRAKMGALYSTAASAIKATSGPDSTTNKNSGDSTKPDNSITTDQRFMGVKLPGLSSTKLPDTLGGMSSVSRLAGNNPGFGGGKMGEFFRNSAAEVTYAGGTSKTESPFVPISF